MKRFASIVCTLFLLALTGCGDSHESIMKERVRLMEDVASTLESVKDSASAKQASEHLKSLEPKMKDIDERAKKLGTPDAATTKQLQEKFAARMSAVETKLRANLLKLLQFPELAGSLPKEVPAPAANVPPSYQ